MIKQALSIGGVFGLIASTLSTSAEGIKLRCTGEVYLYEQGITPAIIRDSIVTVDLSGMVVHGLIGGPYRLSKANSDTIAIWQRVRHSNGEQGTATGSIDRSTGKLFLMITRDSNANQMTVYYDTICKIADKLF